jgi:glucosyl-3-phosphoglycerate phosphatase
VVHFRPMVKALLIRHAQSVWNAESRAQGWSDPPLSDLGEAQAAALAPALADLGLALAACSDLERARRTATVVSGALGLPEPVVDARLRERELGWWTGHTGDETAAGWPEAVAAWRAHRLDRPPGGESTASVTGRVSAALSALAAAYGERLGGAAMLVVTHGGVVSALEHSLPHPPGRAGAHPNLSGRWVRIEGDAIVLDERFDPSALEATGGNPDETE